MSEWIKGFTTGAIAQCIILSLILLASCASPYDNPRNMNQMSTEQLIKELSKEIK